MKCRRCTNQPAETKAGFCLDCRSEIIWEREKSKRETALTDLSAATKEQLCAGCDAGCTCARCRWLKEKTQPDPVNRPRHYTSHPSGVECIQITEHMGFNLGNALKYIWRCDLKKDAIEDLKKARWYLDREIAKREKEAK